MIRKEQLMLKGCITISFADQFYALAKQIRLAYNGGSTFDTNISLTTLMRQNPFFASIAR